MTTSWKPHWMGTGSLVLDSDDIKHKLLILAQRRHYWHKQYVK